MKWSLTRIAWDISDHCVISHKNLDNLLLLLMIIFFFTKSGIDSLLSFLQNGFVKQAKEIRISVAQNSKFLIILFTIAGVLLNSLRI